MHLLSKRTYSNIILYSSIASICVINFSACNTSKKVAYFQDVSDSANTQKTVANTLFSEPTVQPNDILFISVETIDQRNIAIGSEKQGSNNKPEDGYTVDKNGYIEVPLVGKIMVANHTTSEIKELVRSNASKYFVDPVVNVRILNYSISILGDVARPGTMLVKQEKVSVLDAISYAGDLNITGRRDNVLLIREENGVKKFIRFNLNTTDIFKSPYFYLHSGDVVYIEPIKAKARIATSDTSKDRFITLGSAFISLIAVIYSIASNNSR